MATEDATPVAEPQVDNAPKESEKPDTQSEKTAAKPEETTTRSEKTDTRSQRGRPSNRGKSGFRGRGKKTRYKNVSNYESLPESQDAGEILQQVQFYFSDSNLPIDAYLLKLTGGSENKPVPLKTIHDFKRMRHFQPFSVVCEAVRASEVLNLSKDNEITRKTPLDARYSLDVHKNKDIAEEINLPLSIYAKGFGDEYPNMQLDIETYFEPYGPVNSVRMRRHDDNNFKGSVFVEFAEDKLAEQFLGLEHPTFKTDKKVERELQIMSKKAYLEIKKEEESRRGKKGRHNEKDDWKKRGERKKRGYRDVDADEEGEDDNTAETKAADDETAEVKAADGETAEVKTADGSDENKDAADQSEQVSEESKKRSRTDDGSEQPAKKVKADD